MKTNFIEIKHAKENNLQNLSVKIPKDKLVVITGVSGSGKSSLAFDVIYNEGRRRYVDSLSNYAKQFLGGTFKPKVDSIEGLSPAIAIDQKTTSHNPRSTVGTITEIYDFYRLLYARIGKAYCPNHKILITSQTITQIIDQIFKWSEGTRLEILAPLVFNKKGSYKNLFIELRKKSFLRVKIDEKIYRLDQEIKLDKNKQHNISILIDRIVLDLDNRSRIFEAIQVSFEHADGLVYLQNLSENIGEMFSANFACKYGDFSMPKLEPRLFSFNSPQGACSKCHGLGFNQQVTWDRLVVGDKTILEGGLKYFGDKLSGFEWSQYKSLFDHYKIPLDKKLANFNQKEKDIVLYGSKEAILLKLQFAGKIMEKYDHIEGLGNLIERRFLETGSDLAREYYHKFLGENLCDKCQGMRLNKYALAVYIGDKNIYQLTKLSIEQSYDWFKKYKFSSNEWLIAKQIIEEIMIRFNFLINVGLGYLTLDRIARTLSGGEAQRIRLASQLGSKLTGVIYVLDEPSIGLHQRDNIKLINSLKMIRDLGNSVLVVEHDEETMLASDYILDLGPEAGELGGKLVAFGTPEEIKLANTHTGKFLSHKDEILSSESYRKISGREITIIGASENNLKNLDLTIPLNQLVVVTGVSGSGKSTLINEILYKSLHKHFNKVGNYEQAGKHIDLKGIENLDKVIKISQDPIGKTPRSNPATYSGVFDKIRDLFANTTEAKIRGYLKGRFSFNVRGGRCEKCQGDGILKISMHFLPDVYVKCDQCNGKRYNEETLQVKYKGKNISNILDLSVKEALSFFQNQRQIAEKLQYLYDVGLGYIKLGHSSTLLSGGEAQRVKLATYLQKKATGKTLYILDEPSTGLHHHDIKQLLKVLNRIVDKGDSMIIIEHNLDIIKTADYIIDLGPEGGERGGEIIAKGRPENIIASKRSFTGKYLRQFITDKRLN